MKRILALLLGCCLLFAGCQSVADAERGGTPETNTPVQDAPAHLDIPPASVTPLPAVDPVPHEADAPAISIIPNDDKPAPPADVPANTSADAPAETPAVEAPVAETPALEVSDLLLAAALPVLPEVPDRNAILQEMDLLWSRDLTDEERQKEIARLDEALRNCNTAEQQYRSALEALRGSGIDPACAAPFLNYSVRTAALLAETSGTENMIYSPANLYMALSMLAETVDGESRAQLLDFLGFSSVEEVRSAARALWLALYRDSGKNKTLLANSVWLNDYVSYHPETLQTLAESYFASSHRMKMGTKAANEAVIAWINENTNHLLEEAAGEIETDPLTVLMLVSTLYFKNSWRDTFSDFATQDAVFTNAEGVERTLPFMHATRTATYFRDDARGCTVAELPFEDGTAMRFLLPDEGVALNTLYDVYLSELEGFSAAEGERARILWSVPKFDVSSDMELVPILKKLGLTDLFDPARSDFSPLTDVKPLFVSSVQHAARVLINEDGCEAAAFTVIMAKATAARPEELPVIEMNLNRPFAFQITGADGMPLFVGVVNQL